MGVLLHANYSIAMPALCTACMELVLVVASVLVVAWRGLVVASTVVELDTCGCC